MANLVEEQLGKKEKQEYKGDLAKEKILTPTKFGEGTKFGKAQYRLIIDSPMSGVEAVYFSVIRLMEDRPPYGFNYTDPFGRIEKVKDIYTAGETSSYWGMAEQRKGVQQDKFQQLMANVGQLLKTLFQMVRELRIIDERLEYYEKTYKGDTQAEVALKSIWVDLVEGGSKNPASVLGLGSQVGFVTLPDLFFSIHPKKAEDVESVVSNHQLIRGMNRKIREVLGRKLTQYMYWREKTYKELTQGKEFKLKYMRQHYHVIRLYLNWLRPYLRNIQRLQMKGMDNDKDIIAAFETSKIELEVLGIQKKYEAEGEYGKTMIEFKEIFPVVRVRINYVAMPEIAFQSEGQRGAVHRGKTVVIIDAFAARQEDIDEYKKKLEEDDLELLGAVNASILALKDDLEYYLIQGGEIKKKDKDKEQEKSDSIFAPFKALIGGVKDLVGVSSKKDKDGKKVNLSEKSEAEKIAKGHAYSIYYLYKKTHHMFSE
ncbi:hypothetical protein J4447_04985 [Candidatus Pacearchaeota archaeon]|nr:hypothetical protein [Candidatus Pacearchaeota archaeon]